jgi:hypothetical protein
MWIDYVGLKSVIYKFYHDRHAHQHSDSLIDKLPPAPFRILISHGRSDQSYRHRQLGYDYSITTLLTMTVKNSNTSHGRQRSMWAPYSQYTVQSSRYELYRQRQRSRGVSLAPAVHSRAAAPRTKYSVAALVRSQEETVSSSGYTSKLASTRPVPA